MEEKRSTIRVARIFTESEKIGIIEEYLNGDSSNSYRGACLVDDNILYGIQTSSFGYCMLETPIEL